MKSAGQADVLIGAQPQPGATATFVLGTDGPSPGRKGAARVRTGVLSSKIPQRPSGAGGPPVGHVAPTLEAPDGKQPAWSAAPQQTAAAMSTGGAAAAVPQLAGCREGGAQNNLGAASAASDAGITGQVPGLTPREPQAPGGAATAGQLPIFDVGVVGIADRQPVGLRTPRGGRMRASKYKNGTSPLLAAAPVGPASTGSAMPFSPIAMTPIDDNTYQKLATRSVSMGGPSPMDITPQGSVASSAVSGASNVFLISPLLGGAMGGQAARNGGSVSLGGTGPSAAASLSPAPFQGFTAFVPEIAPSPIFPQPARFSVLGNPAGAAGPVPVPSEPAPAADGSSGGAGPQAAAPGTTAAAAPAAGSNANANGLRFPIQIQIPGAREVQDMFSTASAAFSSASLGSNSSHVNSNNNHNRNAGVSATSATGAPTGVAPQGANAPAFPSVGLQATAPAVAAAAGKKVPDIGSSLTGGLAGGSSGSSSQAGNDCQPAKDNAPKAARISTDSSGVGFGSSAFAPVAEGPMPPAAPPGAAAPAPQPFEGANSAAATTAAALGLAAASAAAVASAPAEAACASPDILAAVAEQLENMARRTREAAAAALAARAGNKDANPAAAAEAMVAALAAGDTSPAMRSVLEMLLRQGVLGAKVGAAGSASDGAPGLAAAVACMIGGLKLEDPQAGPARGPAARAASTGGVASGSGSSFGGVPVAGAAVAASVPFVFAGVSSGGSASGSCGDGSAAATTASSGGAAAVSGPVAAALGAQPVSSTAPTAAPVQQQQTQPGSFVFGASGKSEGGAQATSSGGMGFGSVPFSTLSNGAGVAATRPSSGGSATSLPFTFGVTMQPQAASAAAAAASSATSAGMRSQSGVSASGAAASSYMSGGPSPMSTTPVSANHQPPPQPTASSSSGWTNVPRVAVPAVGAAGNEPLKFTVGSSGGAADAAAAAGPGLGGGITPGRAGGRARAKITPRKGRSATQAEAGRPSGGGASSSSSSMAAAAAAAAPAVSSGGLSERSAAAANASVPSQQPQSQQQQGSTADQGADATAPQATRLKRNADEKKQLGNQKYEQSDFRAAERWYTEAIELLEQQLPTLPLSRDKLQQLFPTLKTEIAVLYSNRSGARLMTSKPQSALDDALRAMTLDPKFMRAASRAATCHCRLGDFAAAHHIIDAAMDRCSASSSHYQDMLKKLNEVVDLGARARAATAAAVAAVANGARDKMQEAADKLAAIRDQVAYCDVVAAARAVLALRLGSCREALTLVAPHPEVPLAQRAASWRLWLTVQARYFRGDLQEALTTCRELQLSLEAASGLGGDVARSTDILEVASGAAAAAYATSAHVTVPPAGVLAELAESMQQQLKLKEEGNSAIKAGRHTDAADLYSRALAGGCCPAFAALLHANRAAAYAGLGQLADAAADCGRARALDPSYYKASVRLASLMVELRRPENAQGLLEPLTKLSAQTGGTGPAAEELSAYKERLAEARSAVSWQKTPHHYKLLGLANNCSEEDVRKAYRRLALKHHPDKAMAAVRLALVLPGQAGVAPYSGTLAGSSELEARVREEASWLFNFINQAHEELSDKTRRRKVDQLLDAEQPPSSRYGSSSAASQPYGSNWYSGGSRYSGGFYTGVDPFFQRPGGAAPSGATGAASRARSATGGGAAGAAAGGPFGGYGSYGSYGGARPGAARPAPANGSGSTRSSSGNSAGAARNSSGAAGSGSGYGGYARPAAGGVGAGGRGAAAGGRKWWEGEGGDSDDDDQERFNW